VGEPATRQPGGHWGPATRLPGGQGGRPPRSRVTGPRDLSAIIFHIFLRISPRREARSWPPSSWAAGVYFCKFPYRKYIFVKNGNKKYRNKKTAVSRALKLT